MQEVLLRHACFCVFVGGNFDHRGTSSLQIRVGTTRKQSQPPLMMYACHVVAIFGWSCSFLCSLNELTQLQGTESRRAYYVEGTPCDFYTDIYCDR